MESLFHHHGEVIYIENIVAFVWFIQNQRQGWASSAARLKEDSDRSDLLSLKVLEQYLFRCFRYVDHSNLLIWVVQKLTPFS